MLDVHTEELRTGLIVPGGYRLDRVVGEGGMGVVWSATSDSGGRFALKFLRTDRTEDQKNTKRMIREATAASSVDHPNIARVVEVGELDSGLPFIVMELLEGTTLAERLRVGKPNAEESARILAATAAAIEAAHAAGIVHRDLKPDNVFLVKSAPGVETVKVLDFGIAKTLAPGEAEGSATSLTTTGAMIGTAYYMAPEQIFGDEDVDGRADVWALGVMLYECLAGKRPTQAAGVGQVIKLITTGRIPPLRTIAPDAPSDLADIAMRALARSREARPTMAEMRDVLERHVRGERKPRGRGWIAVGIAGVVVGGGALALAFGNSHAPVDDAGVSTTTTTIPPIASEPPRIEEDAGAFITTAIPDATAPDALPAIAIVNQPRKSSDAGPRTKDAAPEVFDIPLENIRK